MRFLIDAQLPAGLTSLFEEANHEAVHVADVGLLRATDAEILAYPVRRGLVIVTKDEDFAASRAFSPETPPVVWIRIGNTANRALKARLRSQMPEILAALEAGEAIVEIRQESVDLVSFLGFATPCRNS